MSRKIILTDTDNIIKRYFALEPMTKIAQDYGCSVNVIQRFLREQGIKTGTPGTRLNHVDIINAYTSGESENSIATRCKVSRNVITRILTANSVARRNNADANRLMMSKRTPAENIKNTEAAHRAVKGVPKSEAFIEKLARSRERKGYAISANERALLQFLQGLWFEVVPQKATGRYNIDIAIPELSIAVEVFGGKWHAYGYHGSVFRKRFDYLINTGWLPVIVWDEGIGGPKRMAGAADYIIALAERIRSGETLRRQEHVISCSGEPCTTGKHKLEYRAAIGGNKCSNPIGRNNLGIGC